MHKLPRTSVKAVGASQGPGPNAAINMSRHGTATRLAPREPEVHGLVALMEIQVSRAASRSCWPTRTGPAGTSC
jgi:predicted RNA polymerase sigma factor